MTPQPWYSEGMQALPGDFFPLSARVRDTDSAVLVRQYSGLNTASTTVQRMKKLIPDEVNLRLTSRKIPPGPAGEEGVTGVFAFTTDEQLGRLLGRRQYVGRVDRG